MDPISGGLSDPLLLACAFALAFVCALAFVPLAIRLAVRARFFDNPLGYKQHERSTPYLGGLAVILAFAVSAALFGAAFGDYTAIVGCALVLLVVGTVDDRVGLGIGLRLVVQVGVAVVIWNSGHGWTLFGEPGDLLLTIVWVVGLVNAFNLMDNLDGAASSVAAASALGAGILAAIEGVPEAGALALALAGACAGFLPFNLARPSKIFLGDGGSMPIGLIVACSVTAIPTSGAAYYVLLALVPLAALPILDTTLVVISRRRRGMPVLSGGRDHLSHRLQRRVGTARYVALTLSAAQALMCAIGIALYQFSEVTIVAASLAYLVVGLGAIRSLETLNWASAHLPWAQSGTVEELDSVRREEVSLERAA